MIATLDTLSQDALMLPPEERVILASRMLASVESEVAADADAAWDAEIVRRIERFDAGKAKTFPAAEVFASLREIAPDR